jgi:hypothetical protein
MLAPSSSLGFLKSEISNLKYLCFICVHLWLKISLATPRHDSNFPPGSLRALRHHLPAKRSKLPNEPKLKIHNYLQINDKYQNNFGFVFETNPISPISWTFLFKVLKADSNPFKAIQTYSRVF